MDGTTWRVGHGMPSRDGVKVKLLGRCQKLTIKRFLKAPLSHIKGRRLIIHTLPRRGWMDRDIVLLHTSFQLLVDYIECERPDEFINWDSDNISQHAWATMTALYDWWKVGRPSRETLSDRLEGIPAPDFSEEQVLITEGKHKGLYEYVPQRDRYPDYYAALHSWDETETAHVAEDQLNLHRLVDIRQSMWT